MIYELKCKLISGRHTQRQRQRKTRTIHSDTGAREKMQAEAMQVADDQQAGAVVAKRKGESEARGWPPRRRRPQPRLPTTKAEQDTMGEGARAGGLIGVLPTNLPQKHLHTLGNLAVNICAHAYAQPDVTVVCQSKQLIGAES